MVEEEKPRRKSIAAYQRLFEIAQRFLQSGGNEAIELIWGIGLSRWKRPEGLVDIPMIACGVEIEIGGQQVSDIIIRPKAASTHVELRPFEKLATERFGLAEACARRCLGDIEAAYGEGISPFRPETYEPILRLCGSQLDPEGVYLPEKRTLLPAEPVPEADTDGLTVSDRFVIYARRRSANFVLRDIEKLKEVISSEDEKPIKLTGAARTLALGPEDEIDPDIKPLDAALGRSGGSRLPSDEETIDQDHGDLFFPKPFNDDQVQIIRWLEKSPGLVVQGPPGTGKTHTIANIICHMLATGKRVLVVSHGESALGVIRDQLPAGVRDLAISLTTSEREGLKQVENAISLMLAIVNKVSLNTSAQRKLIYKLETDILAKRSRLSDIDSALAEIAAPHLSPVPGTKTNPQEAAKAVVEGRERFSYFSDRPGQPFAETGIEDVAVAALSDARRAAEAYLGYIDETLPSPANLPSWETVERWHEDLVKARSLSETAAASAWAANKIITKLGLSKATTIASDLESLAARVKNLRIQHPWALQLTLRHLNADASFQRIYPTVASFTEDALATVEQRTPFIAKPVCLPDNLPQVPQLQQILSALVAGRNPFGLLSFGSKAHRVAFLAIRIAGLQPSQAREWEHVSAFISFREKIENSWRALGNAANRVECTRPH